MICAECKQRVAALYRCALCETAVCRTCAQARHVCPDLRKEKTAR